MLLCLLPSLNRQIRLKTNNLAVCALPLCEETYSKLFGRGSLRPRQQEDTGLTLSRMLQSCYSILRHLQLAGKRGRRGPAASKRDLGYAGHSTVVAVVSYRDPHLDSRSSIFCLGGCMVKKETMLHAIDIGCLG